MAHLQDMIREEWAVLVGFICCLFSLSSCCSYEMISQKQQKYHTRRLIMTSSHGWGGSASWGEGGEWHKTSKHSNCIALCSYWLLQIEASDTLGRK